jgi:spore coat protein U-like protein
MRALTLILATLLLGLAGAGTACAQGASSGRCRLQITGLDFGDYDVFDASPTRAATAITIDCAMPRDRKLQPKIDLSAGASQDFGRRLQMSGANRLNYNLYVDPGLSRIAGDGSGGSSDISPTAIQIGGRTLYSVTIYGAIEPHQLAAPGVYFDTVHVTITF